MRKKYAQSQSSVLNYQKPMPQWLPPQPPVPLLKLELQLLPLRALVELLLLWNIRDAPLGSFCCPKSGYPLANRSKSKAKSKRGYLIVAQIIRPKHW